MARLYNPDNPSRRGGSSLGDVPATSTMASRTGDPLYRDYYAQDASSFDGRRTQFHGPKRAKTGSTVMNTSENHRPARTSSTRAKLHKRSDSAGSSKAPLNSHIKPYGEPLSVLENRSQFTNSPITSNSEMTPSLKDTKARLVKPILRKLSAQEKDSIDLSRSADELAGLGIYTSLDGAGSSAGIRNVSGQSQDHPRGYHARSTSGASQFSHATASSGPRPSGTYVHPMRQTPRPYTPPLASSYQGSLPTSILGSDYSSEITGEADSSQVRPAARRAPSSNSNKPTTASQTITDSSTKVDNLLNLQIDSTPSSTSVPGDLFYPPETMSPVPRSSIERFTRLKPRSPPPPEDPLVRQMKIEEERRKFDERQALKARKAEEKANAMQEKQERKEERTARSRAKSDQEKLVADRQSAIEVERTAPTLKHQTKSTWVLFMTWLRTRIFKMGKKLKKNRR